MPEGDTIHRSAARLREVLVGKTVRNFRAAHRRQRPTRTTIEMAMPSASLARHFDEGRRCRRHVMSGLALYRRASAGSDPRTVASVARVRRLGRRLLSARYFALSRRGPAHTNRYLGVDLSEPTSTRGAVQRIAGFASPDSEIAAVLLVNASRAASATSTRARRCSRAGNPFTRLPT